MQTSIERVEIRHFHLFCGLGGGAKGFNQGTARLANQVAHYRCLGGVDVNAAAIRDFERATGVTGTVLDMFDRDQYTAFHGKPPGHKWREATPADIQRAAGNERPHVVFLSAPCKGFSGLLSERRSTTAKYQALNRLTVRGVWLMLEAFADDPPEFVLFENVPRIQTRGGALLDSIQQLLAIYGYASVRTTHDCGELGNLAQSRKRFLLVARHAEKVPPFLYEPPVRPLRAVGDVLGRMPLPGVERGGPMHRIPSLQWQTWVRLAFVEAGSDWRSLKRLKVKDGYLRDYLLMPESNWLGAGFLGVNDWNKPAGTVQGCSRPGNGAFSVADPRWDHSEKWHAGQQYGVIPWDKSAPTVSGQQSPGQGVFSIADPRPDNQRQYAHIYRVVEWEQPSGTIITRTQPSDGAISVADPRVAGGFKNSYRLHKWDEPGRTISSGWSPSNGGYSVADPRHHGDPKFNNCFRTVEWDRPSASVTGGGAPSAGGLAVADPRPGYGDHTRLNVLNVADWEGQAKTVTSAQHVAGGALAVADPRPGRSHRSDDSYRTAGLYGVAPWDQPSMAVSASASHDNGFWSVADPRLPEHGERLVARIISLDNTWHRPFTTLELAALQSLIEPEEYLELDGLSDAAWRERIGNAVPPDAAKAIADMMAETLLLAWSGETFQLSATPIWVRNLAIALSVQGVSSDVAKASEFEAEET